MEGSVLVGTEYIKFQCCSPENIVNNDQCGLGALTSNVDAVERTVGSVCSPCGVIHLNRWDGAAGITIGVWGRHFERD